MAKLKINIENEKDVFARSLKTAREVIRQEACALELLAETLDEDIFKAVMKLLKFQKGRVILTGIGKSGHIARKISSTLCSVGVKSYYLHPAEANHGDLGVVDQEDVVIAISNSGNTVELGNIVFYCNSHEIPLISITSKADSILAQKADYLFLLPEVEEACILGLAPTTSTTMTLALGDALSVALLEERGFTSEDFSKFHPGGSLSKQFLTVGDLYHPRSEMAVVSPDMLVKEALIEMTEKGFGVLAVTHEDGILLGVVTDGDLRRVINDDFLNQPVSEIMNIAPKIISRNLKALEALNYMNSLSITSLFVVESKKLLGLIHIHDCLRAGLAK